MSFEPNSEVKAYNGILRNYSGRLFQSSFKFSLMKAFYLSLDFGPLKVQTYEFVSTSLSWKLGSVRHQAKSLL